MEKWMPGKNSFFLMFLIENIINNNIDVMMMMMMFSKNKKKESGNFLKKHCKKGETMDSVLEEKF